MVVERGPMVQNRFSISKKMRLPTVHRRRFIKNDIAAIGISNQRETFVVWDKNGKPLHNAVVWQCKRSIQICDGLKQKGLSETVNQKTELVIDPYFSATKLVWLFQNNDAVKLRQNWRSLFWHH